MRIGAGPALASTRVAVTGMGMGQAAGIAGAMAAHRGVSPHQIEVRQLQDTLRALGAILEPSRWTPAA